MKEMYEMYTARKIQEVRYAAYIFIQVQRYLHRLTHHTFGFRRAFSH